MDEQIIYKDLTETTFPISPDNLERMSDLEPTDLPLINSYYSLINSGELNLAREFLQSHPQLNNKIHNAKKYNKLADGIVATQRFFLDGVGDLIANTKNTLQTKIDEFRYVGEFDISTLYKQKNLISFLNCVYICNKDCIGEHPLYNETNDYWVLVSKGIKGKSGLGLAPRGIWEDSTIYYVNDLVSYDNKFWQCLIENINVKPTDDSDNWLLIMSCLPRGITWGDLLGR